MNKLIVIFVVPYAYIAWQNFHLVQMLWTSFPTSIQFQNLHPHTCTSCTIKIHPSYFTIDKRRGYLGKIFSSWGFLQNQLENLSKRLYISFSSCLQSGIFQIITFSTFFLLQCNLLCSDVFACLIRCGATTVSLACLNVKGTHSWDPSA